MKWIYDLTLEERRTLPPEQIQIGYCRIYDEPITLASVFIIESAPPNLADGLKEPKYK